MDGPAVTGPRVLLLESVHPDAHAELTARAEAHEAPAPDAELHDLEDVRAIVTRGRGRVNDALLARCPALEVVARAGVGLDNVDRGRGAARWRCSTSPRPDRDRRRARSPSPSRRAARSSPARTTRAGAAGGARFLGEMIAGARAAVVGLGATGARTAASCAPWARTSRPGAAPARGRELRTRLARALDGADVVSLHVALTEETRGLIDAPLLERLAPGATVVNTARPAVVDRAAMLTALESGRVGAYAVDGFEPEPPDPSDPLLAHPGVIATPHVAALTRATYRDLCLATVRGVLAVLGGEEPSGGARRVRS